jgi:hypothetical protein
MKWGKVCLIINTDDCIYKLLTMSKLVPSSVSAWSKDRVTVRGWASWSETSKSITFALIINNVTSRSVKLQEFGVNLCLPMDFRIILIIIIIITIITDNNNDNNNNTNNRNI